MRAIAWPHPAMVLGVLALACGEPTALPRQPAPASSYELCVRRVDTVRYWIDSVPYEEILIHCVVPSPPRRPRREVQVAPLSVAVPAGFPAPVLRPRPRPWPGVE